MAWAQTQGRRCYGMGGVMAWAVLWRGRCCGLGGVVAVALPSQQDEAWRVQRFSLSH